MWILCCAIISFIIVVVFEFSSEIPEWFTGGHKIFSIVNMIASSFLASSIFYFIQSYLPNKKNEETSFIVIELTLKKLLQKTDLIIYWFTKRIIIKVNGEIELKPGKYFSSSEIQGDMRNVARNFDISKDLESTAIKIDELITSLQRSGVLQNLDLEFIVNLNILIKHFEEDTQFRNTLKHYDFFDVEGQEFGKLKTQISEINEAYVILENYYNKILKQKELKMSPLKDLKIIEKLKRTLYL